MWRLLDNDIPSLAWHCASLALSSPFILSPHIVRPVLLGPALTQYDGEIVDALQHDFERLGEHPYPFLASEQSWNTGLRLLMLGGALVPSLVAGLNDASTLVQRVDVRESIKAIHKISSRVADVGNRLQYVDRQTLGRARDAQLRDAQLQHIMDSAEIWFAETRDKTTGYQRASNVWRTWFKPGQPIDGLLAPVRSNNARDIERLKRLVREYSKKPNVSSLIHKTDHKLLGRRPHAKLSARPPTSFTNSWHTVFKRSTLPTCRATIRT